MPVSFLFISLSLKERIQEIKKETELHKSEIQILLEKLRAYTEEKPKYAKTQLNGIDVQKEIIKLIYLMENEKVFYDGDIDLEILAKKLELTKHQLSEILNRVLETNFHDFIQEYRIKEAMHLIENRKDMNILNIAYEVGFQSKSAFNTVFKKKTGYTPIEYKNSKVVS
jgi:AraC-like DNA-binding protein